MSKFALISSLFLVTMVACGGDDDDTAPDARPNTVDAATTIDAATTPDAPPTIDAPPAVCLIDDSYELGDLAITAVQNNTAPDLVITSLVSLDDGTPPDILTIQLWQGYGVFAKSFGPGTYELTGDELAFATCGACVFIDGDFDENSGPGGRWFATGGTLTLTSIEGNLTGTLTNITLGHIDLDTGEPVNDGCESVITSASFDGPITVEGGGDVDAGPVDPVDAGIDASEGLDGGGGGAI